MSRTAEIQGRNNHNIIKNDYNWKNILWTRVTYIKILTHNIIFLNKTKNFWIHITHAKIWPTLLMNPRTYVTHATLAIYQTLCQ